MQTPHVQIIVDDSPVPRSLQAALNRLNARVTIRSLERARANGISPEADVCVIVPGTHHSQDLLDPILADASERACAAMVLDDAAPVAEAVAAAVGADARGMDPFTTSPPTDRNSQSPSNRSGRWNTDELTGRISALWEIRKPMRRMRDELAALKLAAAEMRSDAAARDEQLTLASQIQSDLLPELPQSIGSLNVSTLYLPADRVSGDLYDVSRLDEARYGFSIADATGHGMPAALLSIFIKNSLKGKEIVDGAYRIIDPDAVLDRLNRELVATNLSQCQFVAGLHAVFDATTNQIRWARGGAPYPILLRSGQEPIQLTSEGGLIGIFESQKFEIVEHQFQSGDTLLFYTDGLEALLLSEAPNQAEFDILESPWLDQLRTSGIVAAMSTIRDRAESLNNELPQRSDDVTILALQMP